MRAAPSVLSEGSKCNDKKDPRKKEDKAISQETQAERRKAARLARDLSAAPRECRVMSDETRVPVRGTGHKGSYSGVLKGQVLSHT